jgi:hypothetical protein
MLAAATAFRLANHHGFAAARPAGARIDGRQLRRRALERMRGGAPYPAPR